MSRVRIFNDGKPGYMTTVTDEETGQMISDHITEVTIKATDVMPVATITVFAPVIDIIADAVIKHVCPCCGHPVEPEAQT